MQFGPTTEEEAAIKEAKEALKQARLKMAAEEDELLDAEEQAEEQARREAEALAAEAKAAQERMELKRDLSFAQKDAAAANEQQDCWVEAEGQVAASVEEAFDIGVDSLFD